LRIVNGSATLRASAEALAGASAAPRQYKDKSTGDLADQREGSPRRGPSPDDQVGTSPEGAWRAARGPGGDAESFQTPRANADASPRGPGVAKTLDRSPEAMTLRKKERQRRRAAELPRGVVLPTHVRQCSGTGGTKWLIYTWCKDNPSKKTRIPFLCGSWRCPHCAEQEAAVTYARIRDACAPFEAETFSFFVLTLDRKGTLGGKPFENATDAYRELGYQCERFLARLRRWAIRMGWFTWEPKPAPQRRGGIRWAKRANIESEWVAVVEAHRSGWPHLNLLIHCPELAAWLESERVERLKNGATERGATLIHGELATMALESGWGLQSTAEQVRNRDAIAGYIVKLAGMADKAGGEIAKLTQAPLTAPERFRRLRSGKGFLPPRIGTAEGVTGTLVRRIAEPDGTVTVRPLHEVSDETRGDVVAACYVEQRIAQAELEAPAARRKHHDDVGHAIDMGAELPEPPAVLKLAETPRVSVWMAPAVDVVEPDADAPGVTVERRGPWTVYTHNPEKAERERRRSEAAQHAREKIERDDAAAHEERGRAWVAVVLPFGRVGDFDGRRGGRPRDNAHDKRGPAG
jgi:hypothetical protein